MLKLHYSDPNPYFNFNIGMVTVVTALVVLPRDLRTRIELTLGFPVREPGQQRVAEMQGAISVCIDCVSICN